MTADTNDNYEALVQFLYRAPIGLAQVSASGAIEMLNPMAAQLLMPLSTDGALDNLFEVLATVAPTLPQLARDFDEPAGVVCESLRVSLGESAHANGVAERRQSRVLSISLLKFDNGSMMAVLTDATHEVARAHQELAKGLHDAARTDALTQMPNRAALRDHLQQLMGLCPDAAAREFAVVFINCDRFKLINDTLGHAAGDDVLGLMAGRLRATLRSGDRVGPAGGPGQMAARIGSDEFVIILDGIRALDDLLAVARRLLDVLSLPYQTCGNQISCGISMGLLTGAEASGDADAVLQDASIAMVEAKRAGGARLAVFNPGMRERAAQRGAMEIALRRALERGELFVLYQPVVGLQHGSGIDRAAGVEALVRWQHPERGMVSPLEFIGVAEECGLIGALGDFVLTTACADFMHWQAVLGARAPHRMAVNLSRAQLADPGLKNRVQEILQACGMAPDCLQLEITESLAAQDETVQGRLHELKTLGLTLALDDFGTGYSSLSSLHLLPVDTVKIDRSFVSQAETSAHHRVLIGATLQVARSLGMGTVAEGIETAFQAQFVREIGCDKGQGFLFSRPVSAAAILQWVMDEAPVAAG